MSSPAVVPFTDDFRRAVLDAVFAQLQVSSEADRTARADQLQKEFGLQTATWATSTDLVSSFSSVDNGRWLTADVDLHEFLTRLSSVGVYPSSATGFRWDWSVSALRSLAGEIVSRSTRVLDGIASVASGAHTFANTLGAYAANELVADLWGTNIAFISQVSASKEIRDATTELSKALSEFEVTQGMRVDLFSAFTAFSETAEAAALTGESARLLEFTLRDFRRNGLHLPLAERQRVEAIKKRMSTLGITFNQNLGEENSKYDLTREQLAGIPEDQLARFPKSTSDPESFSVDLKYPSYFPLQELCHVEATRAFMEKKYNQRCMEENGPILEELVRLRAEQASILGYPTHAAYVLETRMAKSPDTVGPFLRELSQKLTPLMEEEIAYWKEIKAADKAERGETIPEGGVTIEPSDVRYLMRLSELKKYKVDDQAIKRYFPLEVVTAGLMSIYQQALGLIFEEVTDRAAHTVWHEEVQLFRVLDADTRALRGFFYLDLFPREGKYGHAAVFPLKPGCESAPGVRQLPVAAMVANFTKPTSDQPSLLQHSEVVTYFHEFGHVMHGICSEVTYARFAGTSVERDFVECPSQMLENWCFEREPLLLMSGHVDDHSKKLPEELIQSIASAKKANAGIFNKRQCILGLFDQYIHTHPEVDTAAVWAKINEEHWPIKTTPNTNFAAGFGHLAGGYDAQYYGYLWSEVYSADMFESRFLAEGLLNTETGLSYRREVISRGGSVDASVMLRNFLGREPNDTAFLRSKGLEVK